MRVAPSLLIFLTLSGIGSAVAVEPFALRWSLVQPVDPWAGFQPGAFVRLRIHEGRSPDRVVTERLTANGPTETLLDVDGKPARLLRDVSNSFPVPGKIESMGTEGVDVEGRRLSCQKTVVSGPMPGFNPGFGSLTVWESRDVPGGLARVEGSYNPGGDRVRTSTRFQGAVVSLKDTVNVAGHALPCALFELEATQTSSGMPFASNPTHTTVKMWFCDQIPGRLARLTSDISDGDTSSVTVTSFGK